MARTDVEAFLAKAAGASTVAAAVRVVSLDELRRGIIERRGGPRFSVEQLSGRLTELSAVGASATLTCAVELVLEAQEHGDPAAWIGARDDLFYPPDVADAGVDLEALVVVRVPNGVAARRAAERLLRSGAFGLVVLDLGGDEQMASADQGRLARLAQQHDAAIVLLTERSARSQGSAGSLVSLRLDATRERVDGGGFRCRVRALKDKQRGPGWEHVLADLVPPDGLK